MSPLTLVQTNGSTPAATPARNQAWLQLSVREFFTSVNWDDQPPEVQEIKQQARQAGNGPLSLVLTVGQFFGAIAWDGIPAAAPIPVMESPTPTNPAQPAADGITLDDFSSLF